MSNDTDPNYKKFVEDGRRLFHALIVVSLIAISALVGLLWVILAAKWGA